MAELVDALPRRHQDKTLEFKLDLSSPDRVVASIVAFANTAGGVVLIGVEDNSRAVRGPPEPTEVEERLANLVSDRIAPSLLVDISIVGHCQRPTWWHCGRSTVEVIGEPQRSVGTCCFDAIPNPG